MGGWDDDEARSAMTVASGGEGRDGWRWGVAVGVAPAGLGLWRRNGTLSCPPSVPNSGHSSTGQQGRGEGGKTQAPSLDAATLRVPNPSARPGRPNPRDLRRTAQRGEMSCWTVRQEDSGTGANCQGVQRTGTCHCGGLLPAHRGARRCRRPAMSRAPIRTACCLIVAAEAVTRPLPPARAHEPADRRTFVKDLHLRGRNDGR